MSNDSVSMLRLLFAISQGQIDHDVSDGERDFDRMMQDTKASKLERRTNNEPKVEARYYHKQLVRAKVLLSRENTPEEYTLFFATMAANSIAEEAVSVALKNGRLAELGHRMDEIQMRVGLEDDECWLVGEGPDDYQVVSNESEELYEKVHDTVFTTVLRRYRLNSNSFGFKCLLEDH